MVQADYRGARGANAGDDFHELWALRQALKLLDQDAALTTVTVEGLRSEDESGTPSDTWDGVDCTFYFGGDQAAAAERIVVDQLKYSAANPHQAWTVARLTHSSNKKQDNSVIGRLAKAFAGLKTLRPDLVASGAVVLRLVSNQPVDPAVLDALASPTTSSQSSNEPSEPASIRTAMLTASGLQGGDFDGFARSLDFSECGRGSRFALEESVLITISQWMDADARTAVNDLMRFVRRAMMPEAKGEFITRESILAQLGFSDFRALFPCPSAIEQVKQLIPREISRTVTQRLVNSDQRICLHGEGGCGKTTALQEIESLLPPGSIIVIFDCYGGGRYLDSDSFRHRSQDAFLQLSNDLARQLRIPLLVSRSASLDYPRVFKKRLDRAAEVTAARAHDALLVIVVDAADNSVTAANIQSERSFIHDFVSLGELPNNVRLLVTARTGRLPSLNLPRSFTRIECTGFTPDETAAHVQSVWNNASDVWIADFDHFSRGNPRVQRYALDYAGTETERALDYLRPNGKELNKIFQEQFQYARRKVGHDLDILAFCSGLIALPRPVPIADLSAVTSLSDVHIRDLATDLAPGIRLTNTLLSFADEDFEHFVRSEAEAQLSVVQGRIADHFTNRHRFDAYAATHVAAALLAAGRRREIVNLINEEREPTPISDPILRREIQLQRLRIAMKVCREAGNKVDAMLTLLIGAEALKTNTAIRRTLVENPDLTAAFARSTSASTILRDPDEIEHHGPLLFHIMAADARGRDAISVREGHRHILAWMQRRTKIFEEQRKQHPNIRPQGWDINYTDIAAETEALLRVAGPLAMVDRLLRWRPRSIALQVALSLSFKLMASGDVALIEECLREAEIPTPWDLFLLTPLALAGRGVDLSRIETCLSNSLLYRFMRLDKLRDTWRYDNAAAVYVEMILTACEVIVARNGNVACVVPLIERIADPELRRRNRLYTSDISIIDLSLRAHTLMERLAGRQATLDTYLVAPPEPVEELPPKKVKQQKRADDEKKEELRTFIGPLLDVYDIRAQALTRKITVAEIDTLLQKAIAHYHSQEYRMRRNYYVPAMRAQAALSITRLMALPGLDRDVLWACANAMLALGSKSIDSAEAKMFTSLAVDRTLHQHILRTITARSKEVKRLKTAADDKIKELVCLARILLPISRSDAESLFNDAIEMASEVNYEAIHEIALFAPFAERAVAGLGINTRREVARDLAIVISDAGVRLAGYDHFPWAKAAEALTTLDVSLALAAATRWEDSSIVSRGTFLPSILETALSHREFSPTQVSALSPLLDDFSVELIAQMVEEVNKQRSSLSLKLLTEHLAREELLRFGRGLRQEVSKNLGSVLMSGDHGFWLDQLVKAAAFHGIERPSPSSPNREQVQSRQRGNTKMDHRDPLADIDWAAYRFVTEEDIQIVFDKVLDIVQMSSTYVASSTILDRIGDAVALGDRVSHLEALSRGNFRRVTDYELAQAIVKRIDEWQESPSVERWYRERFVQLVLDRLPHFIRWLTFGQAPILSLLKRSGLPSQQICSVLIEAVERQVDSFDAPTVYSLVGLIGQYCTPDEAAQVIARYASRLVHRIPPSERDSWDLTDLPTEVAGGVARALYALMGDIDVRNRWRAAYAVRCLARLGDTTGILDKLVELYDRTSEPSYRKPDAPFYWLAARLWLVITLDRIAAETPSAVRHHGIWLLGIAQDEAFPHVLLRSFAKSAVCKLVESGDVVLSQAQRDALKRANTSPVRRKKARRPYSVDFDGYEDRPRKDRRFDFNSMDTLPYWYAPVLRIFADVRQEEFLDTAERWIVDRWDVQNNPHEWEAEPRKHRDDWRSLLPLDHRHGSLPILERFHTYLEWHAMWCTIGDLMRTRALARNSEDDYDTFENRLSRGYLTAEPLWLGDLRSAKPLEERLWFLPQSDVDMWVDNVSDEDFLVELGLISDNGMLVVSSYHETQSRIFKQLARIETALVSPDTAAALVRALQTVNDSWDYRIPPAGDEREIDTPPYKLVGWLVDVDHRSGIDEHDPFRYEVRAMECIPSSKTAMTLHLESVYDGQVRWVDAHSRDTIVTYEAWGDNRGDEREDNLRYDERIRSSGWRLHIEREALRKFLNEMKLDLIVEVEITRRNKPYEYSLDDEEKPKEARYDRVFLLRRDGTIEAAEGHIGTWTSPRS